MLTCTCQGFFSFCTFSITRLNKRSFLKVYRLYYSIVLGDRSTEWKRVEGALRAHFLLTLVVPLNEFTDGRVKKNSKEE